MLRLWDNLNNIEPVSSVFIVLMNLTIIERSMGLTYSVSVNWVDELETRLSTRARVSLKIVTLIVQHVIGENRLVILNYHALRRLTCIRQLVLCIYDL
jgi:hypothetical protein